MTSPDRPVQPVDARPPRGRARPGLLPLASAYGAATGIAVGIVAGALRRTPIMALATPRLEARAAAVEPPVRTK